MIRLFLVVFIAISCTTKKELPMVEATNCRLDDHLIDNRAIVMSIAGKKALINHCYSNYLKFHPELEEVMGCMHISVRKNGKVRRVFLADDRNLFPKDLKMCIEQQIWTSNFRGLQLDRGVTLKFPIHFKK